MDLAEKLRGIEDELKDLSKEEREKRVNEILSSLSEEEIEELKQQQCIFCSISHGQIKSFDVYEDDFVKAVLDVNPANNGHVLLFPKEHYSLMAMMDDKMVMHLFKTANMLSKAVFEGMKAQGTNIYVANGKAAGQVLQHVIVHIIPRFDNDNITLKWDGKKLNEDEMNNAAKEIRSKIAIRKEVAEEKKEVKIVNVPDGRRRLP